MRRPTIFRNRLLLAHDLNRGGWRAAWPGRRCAVRGQRSGWPRAFVRAGLCVAEHDVGSAVDELAVRLARDGIDAELPARDGNPDGPG